MLDTVKKQLWDSRVFEFSNTEFTKVRTLLKKVTGIALADDKKELFYRRRVRRLQLLRLGVFAEYSELLEREGADKLQQMINAMTTNHTSFFREAHYFDVLARDVLAHARARRVGMWSAGCSTGEEVLERKSRWDIRVLATEMDTEVLAEAARGAYATDRLPSIQSERPQRWPESVGQQDSKQSRALNRWLPFKHTKPLVGERTVNCHFLQRRRNLS